MPLYKGQQIDLEIEMGINLDGASYSIKATKQLDGSVTTFSSIRVGQTDRIRRVLTAVDTADFVGEYGFNAIADFGVNNIVPSQTVFLEFKELGS